MLKINADGMSAAETLLRVGETLRKPTARARVRGQIPPFPSPTQPPKPVISATDDMCGFPLILPNGLGGLRYGVHAAVKVSGGLTECMDCGQAWDTNDVAPPDICKVRDGQRVMALMSEVCRDFPFAKESEVTSVLDSDPDDLKALEQIARRFARHVGPMFMCVPYSALTVLIDDMREWLRNTPFIPNGVSPARKDLALLVGSGLAEKLDSTHDRWEFGRKIHTWCLDYPEAVVRR